MKNAWGIIFFMSFCSTMIFDYLATGDVTGPAQKAYILFAIWFAFVTGMTAVLFAKGDSELIDNLNSKIEKE